MSVSPTRRYGALALLLVVGLLFIASFGASLSSFNSHYASQKVNPRTDVTQITHACDKILNLDRAVAQNPPSVKRAVRKALRSGSYDHRNSSTKLFLLADDNGEYSYATYHGSYYRWNSTTTQKNSRVHIELHPTTSMQVANTLATPYQRTSPAMKRLIHRGNDTPDRTLRTGLVKRGETFYAITITNEGEVFGELIFAGISVVLKGIGQAYLAVALGLLILIRRSSGDLQPLSSRRALGIALGVIPLAWIITTLTESGSIVPRYIADPWFGFCVALGVFAGYTFRSHVKRQLVGVTVLIMVGSVLVVGLLSGVIVAVLVLPALAVAWIASLPLVPYGYYFTQTPNE